MLADSRRPSFTNPIGETLIGVNRHGREVLHWANYGIVCPDNVTTNGNVYMLLDFGYAPVELTPAGVAWFVGFAFSRMSRR